MNPHHLIDPAIIDEPIDVKRVRFPHFAFDLAVVAALICLAIFI